MGVTSLPWPGASPRIIPLRALSDERLAQLVGTGDRDAFGLLYERYRAPLSRYCRSIVRNAEDAGDALQSTMLAALRSLRSQAPRGAIRPWLYRIAHNESVSVLRRRHPDEELSDRTLAPERGTLARERWESVLGDLQTLPTRQRGALVMHELGGLSYAEIGTALAAGRDRDCDEIRLAISDGDRRSLRARGIRGHLQACASCAAFERDQRERTRALALIPILPGVSVGALLAAGGSAVPGAGAGIAVMGGTSAAKAVALAGALALAGAGAVVGGGLVKGAPHRAGPPALALRGEARPSGEGARARGASGPGGWGQRTGAVGTGAPSTRPRRSMYSAAPRLGAPLTRPPQRGRPMRLPALPALVGWPRRSAAAPPPGARPPLRVPPTGAAPAPGSGPAPAPVPVAGPTPAAGPSPAPPPPAATVALTPAPWWLSNPLVQQALALAEAYGGAGAKQRVLAALQQGQPAFSPASAASAQMLTATSSVQDLIASLRSQLR